MSQITKQVERSYKRFLPLFIHQVVRLNIFGKISTAHTSYDAQSTLLEDLFFSYFDHNKLDENEESKNIEKMDIDELIDLLIIHEKRINKYVQFNDFYNKKY